MSYRIDEIEAVEVGEIKQPKLYDTPVDLHLVNFKVIKNWITRTMENIIPDDDIIIDYIEELLYQGDPDSPNIKEIETQLNSFLGPVESRKFCKQLWKLLVSAQQDKDGIPKQLIEQEKERLDKEEQDKQHNKKQQHDDRLNLRSKGYTNRNQQNNPIKYQTHAYKRSHANNITNNITHISSNRGNDENIDNNTNGATNPPHKIRGKYNVSGNNNHRKGEDRYRDTSRGEYERHRDRSPRRTG